MADFERITRIFEAMQLNHYDYTYKELAGLQCAHQTPRRASNDISKSGNCWARCWRGAYSGLSRILKLFSACPLRSRYAKLKETAVSLSDVSLYDSANALIDDPEINVISIASYDKDHLLKSAAPFHKISMYLSKSLCRRRNSILFADCWAEHPGVRLSTNLVLRASPRFMDLRSPISEGFSAIYHLEADYNYGRLSSCLMDGEVDRTSIRWCMAAAYM